MTDAGRRRWFHDVAAVLIASAGAALSMSPAYRPVLPVEAPGWWWADLAGGVLAVGLVLGRRRAPIAVAVAVAVLAVVVTTAWTASFVGVFAVAVRRPWPAATVVAAGGLGLTAVVALIEPSIRATAVSPTSWTTLGWGAAISIAVIAGGHAVRVRHALLASLIERAETAETEAALRADAARSAERTRIAREMHDVLAHRLSLLSMHAGALAHRRHPEPDEVRDAVEVIRTNARDALQDLRAILGVLRDPGDDGSDGGDGVAPAGTAPQPTLADLPRLVDGVRATGTSVDLHDTLYGGTGAVPDADGRALYRVVQEALTNAARHAPGRPVTVRLAGEPGGEMTLEVENPLGSGGPPSAGSGHGLVGITERVELAGGRVRHRGPDGDRFRLAVALPWREPVA